MNLSHLRWGDGTNGGEMSLFWGGVRRGRKKAFYVVEQVKSLLSEKCSLDLYPGRDFGGT